MAFLTLFLSKNYEFYEKPSEYEWLKSAEIMD
jgi:hypothetical protein